MYGLSILHTSITHLNFHENDNHVISSTSPVGCTHHTPVQWYNVDFIIL